MSKLAAVLSVLLLSACALGGGNDASRVFVLRPLEKPADAPIMPAPTQSMVVALPSAAPGLDTKHIILFNGEHALDFYQNAEWASRLPELVRASLVGAFENSGRFSGVVADNAGLPGNYLLIPEIRRFEAQYADSKTAGSAAVPTVQLVIAAKLIRMPAREVLTSFESAAGIPASAETIADVVNAFEQAFHQVQQDLLTQTLTAINRSIPPSAPMKRRPRR